MKIKTLFKWLIPVALLLFLCIAIAGITGGLTWLTSRSGDAAGQSADSPSEAFSLSDLFKGGETANESPTTVGNIIPQNPAVSNETYVPVVTKPLVANPSIAVLQSLHGLTQVQNPDGSWYTIQTIDLTAGQTFRTWAYSSAALHFYDGSYVLIDADSRLTLETVNAPTDSPRTITLFQAYGHTTNHVASAVSYGIAYDVRTPSSTGTAKGTVFEVSVQQDKSSAYEVLEGSVEVTGKKATVHLNAGQTCEVEDGEDPTDPVFWITGEGEVTQTGEVWIIGGLDFQTDANTLILGDPQVGDFVRVRGHLLPDGTRLADRITLVTPSDDNTFRLTGLVENMSDDLWLVSGHEIHLTEETFVEDGITVGSRVLVTGVIHREDDDSPSDGQLFAERITLLEEDTNPFEFTGLVESISDTLWVISGVDIVVNEHTEITGDPVVGDFVHVEGRILEDGTWLAREIKKVETSERFELIGTVESIAPWIVAGTSFEVNEFTHIEPGILVGSLVRVTGRILEDGTWLARSIELLDESNTLVFIGIVDSIDPWVVNGLSLTTDANSQIDEGIVVNSLVRVTVLIQLDGTWLIQRMELLDIGPVIGCVEFVSTVTGLTSDTITLANGLTIPRAIAEVEGDLQIGSRVFVKLCFGRDNVPIYAWIFVLEPPRPTPTPEPTPGATGTPEPGDQVTVCHIPPGNSGNAHTITVGASAVDAHLAHGDHLGPCTGNEGNEQDKDDKKNDNKDH